MSNGTENHTKLQPDAKQFSGRLYGLQEAAVIAGETSIGLAIYERIKLLEQNDSIRPSADSINAELLEALKASRIMLRIMLKCWGNTTTNDNGQFRTISTRSTLDEAEVAIAKAEGIR